MVNILYKIMITYKDVNEVEYKQPYELYARDSFSAKKTALEVFSMEFGTFEVLDVVIDTYKVDSTTTEKIKTRLLETIGVLSDKFKNLSYSEFLMKYVQFSGYNLEITDSGDASFKFKFLGFTCEAIMENGLTHIKTDDIVYNSSTFKQTYIIRHDMTEIFIGVEV